MITLRTRRAFTLVELLVVVVIIGILSSLVTVGVMSAVQAAKRTKIAMEMHQISLALETYKNKFGEYPPDLYDKDAVVRHVKKRWPRFQLSTDFPPSGATHTEYQYWTIMNAISNVYKNSSNVDIITSLNIYDNTNISTTSSFMDITNNDTSGTNVCVVNTLPYPYVSYIGALPLWLGGFPNPDGKFAGFSADPEAPFGKDYVNPAAPRVNNGAQVNTGSNFNPWNTNDIRLDTRDKDSVFYEMIIGKNIGYVTTQDSSSNNIVFPVLVNRDAKVNKDGVTPVPYVYFKSRDSRGGSWAHTNLIATGPDHYQVKCYDFRSVFSNPYNELNAIVPYAKTGDPFAASGATLPTWQEPERFQLIHPGLDGVFGNNTTTHTTSAFNPTTFSAASFRSINTNITVNDIGQKDFDNLTNFSDYQQIKSILP